MNEEDEALNGILQSADRHPNSRVSKLIRLVESERTQKNIVMLLIELAESAEYATDFGISLKYYLDLFERLGIGRDIMLNETGLLLLNSSKIYSRRVDYVQELIERQILTLSNADREIAEAKNSTESVNVAPEKPKRGRKRLIEAPKDPYEVELAPKKFRKISEEKRFAVSGTNAAVAKANHVKLKAQMRHTESEQHIHPAGWVHSSIVDLENDEEIDSKRNYKLFTYHVEHRYNTLVPDINFRLHFMVKDFIDEKEEMLEEEFRENGEYPAERAITWPPLSEAYVEQYLELENKLLEYGDLPSKKKAIGGSTQKTNSTQLSTQDSPCEMTARETETHSDISSKRTANAENEHSVLEANESHLANESVADDDNSAKVSQSDSGLGESINASNESSIVEDLKDEENESSFSCDQEKEQSHLNSLRKKDVENDVNKIEKEEDTSKSRDPESGDKNEDNDITSGSILDASDNISNEALNSTSINSSSLSSSETTNMNITSIDLSTSEISANESATNECNSTKTSDQTTNTSCPSDTLEKPAGSTLDRNSTNDESSNTLPICQDNVTDLLEIQNETVVLSKVQNLLKESPINASIKTVTSDKFEATVVEESEKDINLPIEKNSSEDDTKINLDEIRIHLPHLDDEGVFFSDLDEQDQRMLSPTVMALDVFPSVPNKNNLTIIVDDDIRAMLNLIDDEPETYIMPEEERPKSPLAIRLNIMKLPEKTLRRRVLFKLGVEFDLYLQARMQKRKRIDEPARELRPLKQMKWFHLNDEDMCGVHTSPMNSPGHSSGDFHGFSDNDDNDDNDDLSDFLGFSDEENTVDIDDSNRHRLSRDSGVDGVEGPTGVDKTCLNTITEEELESQEKLEDLTKSENKMIEDVSDATSNIKKIDERSNAQKENQQNGDIEHLTQDIEKVVNDGTTNETAARGAAVDVVEISTKENADENIELEERNKDMGEITEAQNLDDLLVENIDVNISAEEDVDADHDVLEKNDSGVATIENNIDYTLDEMDLNSSKTKIQQWHEHLQPILAKSRERHHFDVFEIGTEILNELTQDLDETRNEKDERRSINFQNVMENKDSSYVSRYFLSSLLLANQSNITINVFNKSSDEPSAWKDIQFELLSRKRHTVSIEDNIGMVTKGVGVSDVPKKKTPKPQQKRVGGNYSSVNNISTASGCATQSVQHHAQFSQLVKVNLDVVKPLKHIEKLPGNGDDFDSGIFSSEELM